MEENNNERKNDIRPLTCPVCGNHDLAFVAEYHKAILCRFFAGIALFFIAISVLLIIKEFFRNGIDMAKAYDSSTVVSLIISVIIYGGLKIAQYLIESKTHVKIICKRCGKTGILNE